MSTRFSIEVAYALPEKQLILLIEIEPGTTALEAALQSGISEHFPELDIQASKFGIFSEPVTADTVLQPGDRLEIYRPLRADPKLARRNRAKQSATARKIQRKAPPVSVRTR